MSIWVYRHKHLKYSVKIFLTSTIDQIIQLEKKLSKILITVNVSTVGKKVSINRSFAQLETYDWAHNW